MGIQTWIAKRRAKKIESGAPIYKPSEVAEQTGGYVSTTDPNIPAAYQGSAATQQSGGGSGGIATSPTSIIPSGTAPSTPTTSTTIVYPDVKLPTPSARVDIPTQIELRRDIYDPRTGTYKTTPYGYGAGGTVLQRIPTQEERIKIDTAQRTGELGYQLTGTSQEDYGKVTNLYGKTQSIYKELEEDTKKFDKKYEPLIKDDLFIGTEQEYSQYQKDYEKINRKQIKAEGYTKMYKRAGGTISKEGIIEMPKVTIGGGKAGAIVGRYAFFGAKGLTKDVGTYKGKEYSLERFKALYSPSIGVQASAGVGFLGMTGGRIVGETFEKL